MLDLIVWGFARAYQKWKTANPQIVEGSVEDLRALKDLVDALGEDNQKLIDLVTNQQKTIGYLKVGIVFSFIVNVGVAWSIHTFVK